jgi:DHA2 family multidrug resistance protein
MMFVLGVILFGGGVLMPQFLQTLMGYSAVIAGALSTGGLVLLAEMPVVGKLTPRVQARYLIAAGWRWHSPCPVRLCGSTF